MARKAGIIGFAYRLGRRRGVEIDGNSQMGGSFKDREEVRIVEKQASSRTVKKSAVKAEAGDAALQFNRCRDGVLQRKRCKAAETCWMQTYRLGQFIIDVMGERSGRIGIECIETHRGQREHLKIDLRPVHVGDPASAEVKEFRLQFRKLRGSFPVPCSSGTQKGFGHEVFFKRDGAHGRLDDASAPRVSFL